MGQSVARRGKSDEDAIDAKGNLYDWIDRGGTTVLRSGKIPSIKDDQTHALSCIWPGRGKGVTDVHLGGIGDIEVFS